MLDPTNHSVAPSIDFAVAPLNISCHWPSQSTLVGGMLSSNFLFLPLAGRLSVSWGWLASATPNVCSWHVHNGRLDVRTHLSFACISLRCSWSYLDQNRGNPKTRHITVHHWRRPQQYASILRPPASSEPAITQQDMSGEAKVGILELGSSFLLSSFYRSKPPISMLLQL